MTLPTLNLVAILPQIVLVTGALLVLLIDALRRSQKSNSQALAWLALFVLLLAGASVAWLSLQPGRQAFQDMLVADGYALAFAMVILIAAALGVLLAKDTVAQISDQVGAFYALLLLAVVGMVTMGAATDLIVVFLALEILSLALYIMVGYNRHEPRSAEASLKYFLLGAFASGFFLYGAALVYGATGTTNLPAIASALSGVRASQSLYLYAGTALLIVGFGFKIAVVPFHMWTPDAYQGAPTSVTGFMSVATKAAAFAAFMRVFVEALPASQATWSWALAILAALTMTLGNLAALRQSSLKRMLAYSSIAHAGYALVGLVPGTTQGVAAVIFYLFTYAFMNLGAFAVVIALERLGENDVLNGQFAGLSERHPAMAAAMAVFMFSLAGIPPLAGFFAKFFVFSAAMEAGWTWLVVIGVVNSVISAFYYLYITVQMYFKPSVEVQPAAERREKKAYKKAAAPAPTVEPTPATPSLATSRFGASAVMLITALATVIIGIAPTIWTNWIGAAVRTVFGG